MANKGMLIVLGAAAIGVGAYWYFASQKSCSESVFGGVTSEYECMARELLQLGCVWEDGICKKKTNESCTGLDQTACAATTGCFWCETPAPGHCQGSSCGSGGSCTLPGYQRCVGYDLYKCMGGYYELIESNSYDCRSGITHKECFVSTIDNVVGCYNTVGEGEDTCRAQPFSDWCPCDTALCDTLSKCYKDYCFPKGGTIPVSADVDQETWDASYPSTDFSWCSEWGASGVTKDKIIENGRGYMCNRLTGSLLIDWGMAFSAFDTRVFAYNRVDGWVLLDQRTDTIYNPLDTTITLTYNLLFNEMPIEKLRFGCCNNYDINFRPRTFNGTLIYG